MEFILHFMYVVAIKDTRMWQDASPMELSMVGFWNLIIVWLKVLCSHPPWHSEISNVFVVTITVEVLPLLGSTGWGGAFGEYGPVYGEQLFGGWILEELASQL
jgi:hypothetical protein